MNADKRRAIFERLRRANPNPTTELHYDNTFQLLVAVILSAQATDKGVNKATAGLFRKARHPRDILDMGEQALREQVRTIGLFNTKAANIYRTCALLEELHEGQVPEDRAALEALPGVGRKTANVILNTAFGHPVIAVDTHIFRVSNRTAIARGKTVLEVEKRLQRLVPTEYLLNAHHWLILLGRYTCIARKPLCGDCGIHDLCEYRAKTPAAATA